MEHAISSFPAGTIKKLHQEAVKAYPLFIGNGKFPADSSALKSSVIGIQAACGTDLYCHVGSWNLHK
jgi:hypothetical protein